MNASLKEFLQSESDDLGKDVRELMNHHTVSLDDVDDTSRCCIMEKYYEAIKAVRKWLRSVALCSMLENSKKSVNISLELPDDSIEVGVSIYMPMVDVCYRVETDKTLKTPIGHMDRYVYSIIKEINDNPVIQMYKFLDREIRLERQMVEIRKGDVPILSGSILDECGIKDVLGVYRMGSMMKGIDSFLYTEWTAGMPLIL